MIKMPANVLILLLSLILNSCKAQEARKSPPYQYYYMDQELPFILWADPSYGKSVFVEYGEKYKYKYYQGDYNVEFFLEAKRGNNYDPLQGVDFALDLYDTKELEGYIKDPERQLDPSSACFNEIEYDRKGVKTIPLRLFNAREGTDTASPSLWKTMPVKLYVYKQDIPGMDYEKPPFIFQEVFWIVVDRSPDLPPGKALRIKLAFPPFYNDDSPEDTKIKKQAAQFLCDTARRFTWVDFGERFKPSLWKKIQFSDDLAPAKVYIHREKK